MTKKKCITCKIKDAEYCTECKNDSEKEIIVVDPLLTYVTTYLSRSSALHLRVAVLAFYSMNQIHEARYKLYDAVADVIECDRTDRQNSTTRSAKEAELDDILETFKKMDEAEENIDVKFYADDITQLPPAAPEAGGTVMALLEVIAKMQRDLSQVQDVVCRIENEHLIKVPTYASVVDRQGMQTGQMKKIPSYAYSGE